MKYTINDLLAKHGVYIDNVTIKGENHLIEFITVSDDFICEDINNNVIANLDINAVLIPKILNKGVFETVDTVTKEIVSIQFYKCAPFEIKNSIQTD